MPKFDITLIVTVDAHNMEMALALGAEIRNSTMDHCRKHWEKTVIDIDLAEVANEKK